MAFAAFRSKAMVLLLFISCLSVTSHINCSVARCLINVIYLTECAFIRSWWRCTFWMMSPMTLNQQSKIENYIIIASLMCKSAIAMSTSVFRAMPGKLDIKRHSPSILYSFFTCCCSRYLWEFCVVSLFCWAVLCILSTVVPTKSDSDVIICSQLLSLTLAYTLHLS